MQQERGTKIKILFAINCMNIGGAPSVVFQQMKLLDKEQFEPHLLMLYRSKPANFLSQMDFVPSNHIHQFHLKRRSIFDVATLWKIYRHLRSERYDIVYTHLFLTNFLVRALAILAGVPHIVSFEHSVYFNKSRWQIVMDRLLSHFTDRIIVSTESVRDFTAEQQAIPKSMFAVIRNPVSVPNENEVDRITLSRESNIDTSSRVTFVTVGRFSEEKGQEILLSAAEKVVKKYPEALFLLVGHGPSEAGLEEYVLEHDLETNVRIIHAPNRAKEYLFLADWFVLPSLREGQAMVVEEAMTVGVPVISADLPGIHGIVEDGVNGYLFETGNADALAVAIGKAIDRSEHHNEMKREAKRTAERLFSNSDRLAQLEQLFLSLLR